MANSAQERPTNTRLLRTKRRLGLSGMARTARAIEGPPERDAPTAPPCVNCGYVQQGQIADRCPECGLALAASVRELAPWADCENRWQGWLETCLGVWRWNRRVRINMSLLPTTARSAGFARRAVLVTALLLGCALVAISPDDRSTGPLRAARSLVVWVVGAGTALLSLQVTLWLLVLSLCGTWRTGRRFVPSSVHYSTAWWPPLAGVVLLATAVANPQDAAVWTSLLVLIGLCTWGLWLWAGATECLRLPLIGGRILVISGLALTAAIALINFIPGPGQTIVTAALTQLKANISNLVTAGQSAVVAPKTYALVLDMIPGEDEWQVNKRLSQWGMTADTCHSLSGSECTIEAIEAAFEDVASRINPQRDRYVIYINGHGAQNGAGSIQMADRPLTTQKLTGLIGRLPGNGLVVIDSCFGGKFIDPLRGSCNAVVLTSTDDRNLGFLSGLRAFWKAFDDPAADYDFDGRVDLEEAYCRAYPVMLRDGETSRQRAMNSIRTPPGMIPRLDAFGRSTPQLEYLGSAGPTDFTLPAVKAPLSRPATGSSIAPTSRFAASTASAPASQPSTRASDTTASSTAPAL